MEKNLQTQEKSEEKFEYEFELGKKRNVCKEIARVALDVITNPILPMFQLEVDGKEYLPEDGPYFLCANHESDLDPLLFSYLLYPERNVYWIAKKELFQRKFSRWLLGKQLNAIPVDRNGSINNLKEMYKSVGKVVKNGDVVGIFPTGTRSKNFEPGESGTIQDGAAYLAMMTQTPMVPAYIKYGTREAHITIHEPIQVSRKSDVGKINAQLGRIILPNSQEYNNLVA